LWELAEAELACAHYSIKRNGCYIYPINQSFDPESESHFFPEGVKITTEGFTALNIPFGNESYANEVLEDIFQNQQTLQNELLKLESTQAQLILLRMCANARVNYWNRLIDPFSQAKCKYLMKHDSAIISTFSQVIKNSSAFSDEKKMQICLSMKNSGMGLTASQNISHAAYYASTIVAASDIWQRFQSFWFMPDQKQDMLKFQWILNAKKSWDLLQQLFSQHIQNHEIINFDFQKFMSYVPQVEIDNEDSTETIKLPSIQHLLSEKIDLCKLDQLLSVVDEISKSRIFSASGPGNAGFLTAIPTEQSLSMSNVQMVTAVRLRLGLPVIPAIETTQFCSCGKSLDLLGNHLILCKRGAQVSQRHNMLVQAWTRLIKKTTSAVSLSIERTLGSLGCNNTTHATKRVDVVQISYAERTKLSDITVIHPNPENNQHRGAAAAFKEKEKIRKYGEAVSKMEMDFLPIAFETYGRIGETARSFVKNLINQLISRMTNGGRDLGLQNKLYYIWWSTLSCALQKGNSGIVNYRFFNISNATHSNILSCFSVNELQS